MSISLVRKGLDLFKDSKLEIKLNKPKRQNSVHTKKQGMKKYRKRLKQNTQGRKVNTDAVSTKNKRVKSALDEYSRRQPNDCTDDNVTILKALSKSKLAAGDAAKIIEHNQGKLAKDRKMVVDEDKIQPTAFTEEDFEEFDKQYHVKKIV